MKQVEQERPQTLKVRFLGRFLAILVRALGATVRLTIDHDDNVKALL